MKTCPVHAVILGFKQACPLCPPKHFDGKGINSRHSRPWRRNSHRFLDAHPLCERCAAQGLVVAATEVHHVVDRHDGGPLFPGDEGLEGLCKPCHARETASRQHATSSGMDTKGVGGSARNFPIVGTPKPFPARETIVRRSLVTADEEKIADWVRMA
jgi:HNH endonuclease